MTNKRILTLITLLLFLLLVVGCDVIKPNQPPVITSDPVETATVGVAYTYNVIATDPNTGDVLTYSLTTEPEGMLIDEDSGVITWKADDIAAAGVGDHDVVVVVSDDDGLIDSQDFTITVGEFVVELVGIEVEPEEIILCVPISKGLDETFTVTADYNDGSTAEVTLECVYGIDDTSIAKIETGKVTALKVGTATISISYTEEGITEWTTLNVIVEGTIAIHWLEAAVRYNAIGEVTNSWLNDPVPPLDKWGPAELILTGGGYHFADIKDYFNIHIDICLNLEGSVVIDETGLLSGWATYTLNELPTQSDFEGQVEIIIYEEVLDVGGVLLDGTMLGTYTQESYKFGTEDEVIAAGYTGAVLCEGSEDKWFVGRTEYIAHGEELISPQ